MKKILLLMTLIVGGVWTPAKAEVRIKDITELEGARSNQLTGVGIVVGLHGTGSKDAGTQTAVMNMLQRFNITFGKGDPPFKSGNNSMVMVTADLGPFTRRGSKIDVLISAMDDTSSLVGGTLLLTPLKGSDRQDYAVAQGPITVGGFSFGASSGGQQTANAQKNHPTVATIPSGAIVELEARGNVLCHGTIRLLLREADYSTARAISQAINSRYPRSAFALDAGTVQVFVPSERGSQLVSFISDVGSLEIAPDSVAKVVINERTGTVVAGQNVKIATVAVTHGNLAIVTSNQPEVSQPNPFGRGKTVVVPRTSLGVDEQGGQVHVLPESTTVNDFARALNALGVSPRDLIEIFKALKRLGALHAELILM